MDTWSWGNRAINSIRDMPGDPVGFVYRIDNYTNGKFYIGKKSIVSVTNPEISEKKYRELKAAGEPVMRTKNKAKSKKGGKTVWRYKRKQHRKETNWLSYTGSNKELNKDIKAGHKISRNILKFCYTKSELTLREVEAQFKQEVLDRCDSYNQNVLGRFFSQVKC